VDDCAKDIVDVMETEVSKIGYMQALRSLLPPRRRVDKFHLSTGVLSEWDASGRLASRWMPELVQRNRGFSNSRTSHPYHRLTGVTRRTRFYSSREWT